jgi:hypothetical protein
MVKARKNFRRYMTFGKYSPRNVVTTEPTDQEHSEHLIMNAIKANSIVTKMKLPTRDISPQHVR